MPSLPIDMRDPRARLIHLVREHGPTALLTVEALEEFAGLETMNPFRQAIVEAVAKHDVLHSAKRVASLIFELYFDARDALEVGALLGADTDRAEGILAAIRAARARHLGRVAPLPPQELKELRCPSCGDDSHLVAYPQIRVDIDKSAKPIATREAPIDGRCRGECEACDWTGPLERADTALAVPFWERNARGGER